MRLNILLLGLALFSFYACKESNNKDVNTIIEHDFDDVDDSNLPLDERAKKQAMRKIGIPANETISVKVYQAYLNDDNISDAFITINRLEFAERNAKKLKTYEILKRNGYVGNYNFIMIYDGATDKLSLPIPVPSSAKKELEVDFEYLFSSSYTSPVVTFRIKDGEFKNFYKIADGIMDKVFKMKSYEFVGQANEKAYVYEIQEEGMFSFVKDIIVYHGKLENSAEIAENWFDGKAKITKSKEIEKSWYFDPKRTAYVTPN